MQCPQCKELGLESDVHRGGGNARLGKPYPYQDENGVVHSHETMHKFDKYSCSNGHNWEIKLTSKCPACGYEYTGEADPLFGADGLGYR